MVQTKEDMTGWVMKEHGVEDSRLTVVRQVDDYIAPNGRGTAQWLCKCNCNENNYIVAIGSKVKHGKIKSCGCLSKETQFKNKHNEYDYSKEYGVGFCTNTRSEFYFDWEDFDKIKDYSWYEHTIGSYHAVKTYDHKTNRKICMAQLIKGHYCDHKNRNPLDNRKENLRYATAQENSRNRTKQNNNTSGFVGVSWHKQSNKWRSRIKINGCDIHLGSFINKRDAIITRLNAEAKYFGIEFAPQRHLFNEFDIKVDNITNRK